MRTKILAHILDMGAEEGRNPIDDYKVIRKEIEKYSKKLANKKEIIIANKMDLPSFNDNLDKFKKEFPNLEVIPISAINNENISEVLLKLADILEMTEETPLYDEEELESHIIYKFQNELPYTITKEDGVFVIRGEEIEKLFKMTKFTEEESVMRFARKLKGIGVEEELEKMGAQRGDDVQILEYMFQFKE